MSGGSWDYVYRYVRDAAERLQESPDPHRIALGNGLAKYAQALQDIEWTDSCDTAKGSEVPAILAAVGSAAVLVEARRQLEATVARATDLLFRYKPEET